MLRLAAATLRGRWPALVGAFLALVVGVALAGGATQVLLAVATAGPDGAGRLTAAPLVVAAPHEVRREYRMAGETERESLPNPARTPLPAATVGAVAAAPGVTRVVVDREVPLRTAAGVPLTGRPIDARRLSDAGIVAGRAPRGAGEVAVASGTGVAGRGDRLRLVAPDGPRTVRVVGVVAAAPAGSAGVPPTLYLADAEAARLAPVHAVGAWPAAARPAVARAAHAVAPRAQVLAGDDRRRADVDPTVTATTASLAFLGTLIGTLAFVAIFVVASTFALAVALRRRELGLLRAVGATPRQVRRLVLREALLLAAVGAAVGSVLSVAVVPPLRDWLVARDLAPAGTGGAGALWTAAGAAGVGLGMVGVALAGAWLAARRAARVRPVEALRDAAVDEGVMTRGRRIVGLGALGGGVVVSVLVGATTSPEITLSLVLSQALLFVTGITMLVPVVIPRVAAALVAPFARGDGAGAMLLREHARAAVRRTATTAAPLLVAVGLAGALGTMGGSLDASSSASQAARIAPGTTLVQPAGGPMSAADVAALRAVPGARVAPVRDVQVLSVHLGSLTEWSAATIDPRDAPVALRSPVRDGDLQALRGRTVAVGEATASSLGVDVGQTLDLWLPDGTPARLRVVAVLADGLGRTSMYLPPALVAGHAGPGVATSAYVRGGAPDALRAAATARGLQTITDDGPASPLVDNGRMNAIAMGLIVALVAGYAALALGSTAAVGTAARAGELAVLRLAGATPRQTLRLVGAEALLAAALGALAGLLVTAATVGSLAVALGGLDGPGVVRVPWALLGGLSVAGAAIAVVAALLAAARTQRAAPQTLVAVA
ncbi:FtsX-like permease family protein [Patulibacter sp. SYSU D01012]|uniref:FtsX-like permease family protein n=1 Tax=Patulibacter sp. SYSU D01012 TaxID=2817381 RepID=UPI001B31764D|nr:FtsX-like permease family protein [Patulibacter sp. SYSU D01012]